MEHLCWAAMIVALVALAAFMGWVSAAPATSPVLRAHSTSYCLTGIMANGQRVRAGSVAMNRHPLGTRIRLVGQTFGGRRYFVVRDRIGWGSELDFWSPSCAASFAWGRRAVRYRVIGR